MQSEEVQFIGVLQDGHDQSPIESYRDTGIHVAVVANVLSLEGSVDDRKLLESNDRGADKERHEREARAITLFEASFELIPQVHNAG